MKKHKENYTMQFDQASTNRSARGRLIHRAIVDGSAFACTALVLLAAGCSSMGGDFGSVIPEGQKTAVVKGVTTKTQVLRELGNPDQRIDLGSGNEQFSYIKETIKTHGVPFFISQSSNYTEFWITFDNAGIATDKGERATTKQPSYFK